MTIKNVLIYSKNSKFEVNITEFNNIIFGNKTTNVIVKIDNVTKNAKAWRDDFYDEKNDIYYGFVVINDRIVM